MWVMGKGRKVRTVHLTAGLSKAMEGIALPGLDAGSIVRALNGVIVEKLRPKEQAFVPASHVPGSDTIQVDNGSSVLLRLLQAGGLDIDQFAGGSITAFTALETALYHDALVHVCGGEDSVISQLLLRRGPSELARRGVNGHAGRGGDQGVDQRVVVARELYL